MVLLTVTAAGFVPSVEQFLQPGQTLCLFGRVEGLAFPAVVGIPRPAEAGVVPFGLRGVVPVRSSNPVNQALIDRLRETGGAALICGVVGQVRGTGPFAGQVAFFLDAFAVVPLGFTL